MFAADKAREDHVVERMAWRKCGCLTSDGGWRGGSLTLPKRRIAHFRERFTALQAPRTWHVVLPEPARNLQHHAHELSIAGRFAFDHRRGHRRLARTLCCDIPASSRRIRELADMARELPLETRDLTFDPHSRRRIERGIEKRSAAALDERGQLAQLLPCFERARAVRRTTAAKQSADCVADPADDADHALVALESADGRDVTEDVADRCAGAQADRTAVLADADLAGGNRRIGGHVDAERL